VSRLADASFAFAGNTLGMTETCDDGIFAYFTRRNVASLISVYTPDEAGSGS
jgi:hypothetical protein